MTIKQTNRSPCCTTAQRNAHLLFAPWWNYIHLWLGMQYPDKQTYEREVLSQVPWSWCGSLLVSTRFCKQQQISTYVHTCKSTNTHLNTNSSTPTYVHACSHINQITPMVIQQCLVRWEWPWLGWQSESVSLLESMTYITNNASKKLKSHLAVGSGISSVKITLGHPQLSWYRLRQHTSASMHWSPHGMPWAPQHLILGIWGQCPSCCWGISQCGLCRSWPAPPQRQTVVTPQNNRGHLDAWFEPDDCHLPSCMIEEWLQAH